MSYLRTTTAVVKLIKRLRNESSFENVMKFGQNLYCHPFVWDSEEKILVNGNFQRKLIWGFKTVAVSLYSFGNCYALYENAMGSSTQTISEMIREMILAALSIITVLFQLNTFLHMDLVVSMYSQFNIFSSAFDKETHTIQRKPRDLLGGPIKIVLYFYPLVILPQLLRSNSGFNVYHLFGGTNRLGTISFGFLNMILLYQIIGLILFYVKFVLIITSSLSQFAEILSYRADDPTFAIANTVKVYRKVEILCKLFLDGTSSIVLTTGIFGNFLIQTLIYFTVFNYVSNVSIVKLLPLVVVALLSTSVAHSSIKFYNQIQLHSLTFITMLHLNPNSNEPFSKAIIGSVRSLKIIIGPFFVVKKGTFATMVSLVSTTVINMLLM